MTRGAFDVKPGSLFPALNRLEENGWVAASWGRSENNRRARFYTLTKAGQKQLAAEAREWARVVGGDRSRPGVDVAMAAS